MNRRKNSVWCNINEIQNLFIPSQEKAYIGQLWTVHPDMPLVTYLGQFPSEIKVRYILVRGSCSQRFAKFQLSWNWKASNEIYHLDFGPLTIFHAKQLTVHFKMKNCLQNPPGSLNVFYILVIRTDNAQVIFVLIEVCQPGGFMINFSKITRNQNQTTLLL